MKKGIKVFISGLITFLSLEAIASARVLNYTELQKEIEKVNPEAVEARIIGNYVFTDANKLRDQDIMIGALTIPGIGDGKHFTQELYNKMSVNRLLRKINPDTGDYENWSIINNLFGETKITEQTSFDIRYIDYTYLKDTFTVSFNLDGGSFKEKDKTLSVLEDDKIDKTLITGENAPTRSGKKFKAWVKDDGTPWNFETDIVTGNMTLKATWYDEVNTNTLLEEAVKNINNNTVSHGHYYDVSFNKSQKELIFEVFDKNQKNSEIEGTGLIGDIVALVNKENVVSITISGGSGAPVTFEKKDVNNGAGPESNAWKQFGVLLQTLTGKEFKEITLGDLLKLKDLTLKITLKEDTARSQNNNVEESYTIKFSYDAKSTISGTIPKDDLNVLESSYLYVPTEDHYTVTGSNGEYKVSGYVIEQDGVKGFGSSSAKHYFAYAITLDKNVDKSKVKIKVPKKDSPSSDSDYNIYNGSSLDNGVLTVLMEVEDNEKVKYRDIIIEVDGKPTKIRIDFSELKLKKSSKFTIQSVDDVAAAGTQLGEDFGWKKETGFETKFAIVGDTVTVTGLIPILDLASNGKTPFKEEDLTGYYLPFVIKTEKGDKEQNAKLTVQFIHEGEESKTITAESFDGNDVLYILRHLHKDATNKTFKIVVDMDGTGEEYAPYELTFDWNGLKLQQPTVPNVQLSKPSTKDTEELNSYGYDKSKNELEPNASGNSVKLSGTMKEQVVNSDAFGPDKMNGYYFDFTFTIPDGIDRNKVTISRLNGSELSKGIKKEFSITEWQDDGTLTILFRVPEDTKCVPSSENCKLYYQVDYDGDEHEYLPTIYEIDYSGVTFEKSSLFTVQALNNEDENTFPDDGWLDKEGYFIKLTQDTDNPNKYNVSGVLPIFGDEEWDEHDDPLKSKENDYYLGLLLKLVNAPKGFTDEEEKMSIKFLDADGEDDNFQKVTATDFGTSQSLYILKYLVPSDEPREFKITVDLDGEDSEEYVPYTVTIDYTDLEFQNTSLGGVDFDIIDEDILEDGSEEKKELESYEFNPETVKGVSIKTEQLGGEDREASKTGLQGNIKEQTLENGFNNNTGYFVPIKISVPTEEEWYAKHRNDWTITLNTEMGTEKVYTPTSKEYEQGWVLVLFRIDNTKTEEDAKITYKIDFDGKGDAFLPTEYTIKYEDLNFQTENKVTFEYFDEISGKTVTEEKIIYEGEVINPSVIPQLANKGYSFHKFDYWYEKDKEEMNQYDIDHATTEENEDITLKAHWTIDVDKFLGEVITDLANPNSLNSLDFSTHFNVTKNDTTIIFDVLNAETKISEMDKTSIPGTIAYLLQRGEIQDITLTSGGQKVVFTKGGSNFTPEIATASLPQEAENLKEEIKKGAKALYVSILDGEEVVNNMTLRQLATRNPSFTLSIGKLDSSVQLADDTKTTYTFKFESDIAEVTSEQTLKQALADKAKTIFISQEFNISNQIDIERDVLINGNNKAITSSIANQSIFNIKNSNVTIENITLKDAKPTAITVESGTLTTQNVTITGDNLEAGIEVKTGASLEASNMTYEKEHYNRPLVRTEKVNATVNLTDKDSKKAVAMTKKETIKQNNEGNDSKEEDKEYQYNNYYNQSEHSKIYKSDIYNYHGAYRITYTKYNYYGEALKPPTNQVFGTFERDGEKYELIGFTEDSSQTLTGDALPKDAVAKDQLFITKDNGHYWGVFKVTLVEGVQKVSTSEDFKEAISKINAGTEANTNAIYVTQPIEIDYTNDDDDDGTFAINKNVSIIGLSSQKVTIKAKKVAIGSEVENVFIQRISFEINAQDNQKSLIEVEGKEFSLWQSGLKNTGKAVDYAIEYKNNKSIVDVQYMGVGYLNGFDSTNINKSYICVSGKLAAGSDLYFNNFPTGTDDKMSAIIIHGFADDATVKVEEDGEPAIRFEKNDVKAPYGIIFEKEVATQKGDIKVGSATIGIEYDDEHTDFEGIGLYASPSNVKIKYINGTVEESTPKNVKAPKFKGQVVVGES